MKYFSSAAQRSAFAFFTAVLCAPALAQTAPHQGEWDGVTAASRLDTSYEDPAQTPPLFGTISYFSQPWRGYMDTWPSAKWHDAVGVTISGDDKYLEASAQIMQEAGVHYARVEIPWGSLTWDEQITPEARARWTKIFGVFRQHEIRPLILLNAHHGAPTPLRDLPVQLVQDAVKGARVLKLAPATKVRVGYTGCSNLGDYKAAFPLITALADDGTAQLSAPLPSDLKAGRIRLQELKYQPFQGVALKDGTPVPAALETFNGWLKYVSLVGDTARDILGTPKDSGFDLEVWNEMSFGSDFTRMELYYNPPREYSQPLSYRKTRVWTRAMRPDAQLEFVQTGYEAILPATIDYFNDTKNGFRNVRVNSGFSNQTPFPAGDTMWDGQNGLDKHYYTSSKRLAVSPAKPLGVADSATADAFGKPDGTPQNNDPWQIVPGSNFVPQVNIAYPEWWHSAFKTETIERDTFPDSRRTNTPEYMGSHGRYTHNGDFHIARIWQTEVNFDRLSWTNEIIKASGVQPDDARLQAFNDAAGSKMLLRQAIFHLHKGIERDFFFSTDSDYNSIGLFSPQFYRELDKSDGKLTPAARAFLPPWPQAFARISQLMNAGEKIQAPRQLRVEELVEKRPRLVFAGDSSARHPSRYNRDFFAFLPFQVSAQKFAIPFYVVTPDVTHAWNTQLSVLDPKRYDMPPQDFEVTIGNLNGIGAKVSSFDPLTGAPIPVKILKATPSTLTLNLLTTDSPRFLVVEEAKAGIQISDAKIEATRVGEAVLSWKLNRPANAVRISYGGDWPQRGATEIAIRNAPGQTQYRVTLPTAGADMVAARIRVAADGLSAVWPRWDEDPQGQVVMVDAKARPRTAKTSQSPLLSGTATPLRAPDGIVFKRSEKQPELGFALNLPAEALVSGAPDDRTISLGQGASAVTLRVRYFEGAAANSAAYLPFQSSTDTVESRLVLLPAGFKALLSDYALAPTAYPGVSDTRRWYLQLPIGAAQTDLLQLSASGTPDAMTRQKPTLEAIFASLQSTQ